MQTYGSIRSHDGSLGRRAGDGSRGASNGGKIHACVELVNDSAISGTRKGRTVLERVHADLSSVCNLLFGEL